MRASSGRSSATASSVTGCSEGAALCALSEMIWCPGRLDESERAGRDAVEVLERLEPGPELGRAYVNLATFTDDDETAVAWSARALAIAERSGDAPSALRAHIAIDTVRSVQDGRPAGRARLEGRLEQAIEAGHELEAAQTWLHLT